MFDEMIHTDEHQLAAIYFALSFLLRPITMKFLCTIIDIKAYLPSQHLHVVINTQP